MGKILTEMALSDVAESKIENVYEQFVDPDVSYRGKPFWSWNGQLEKDELIRQVHVLKEMGFGGFFMHSRTGLETAYLGEEWFDLINACADEGEKLGMQAWLYDEDRWPSGTAGGMVTANPRYRMKSVQMRMVAADDFAWSDQILAAFYAKLNGVHLYEYHPIDRHTPPDRYKDFIILVFAVKEMAKSNFYNGNTYVDTLNGEATRAYIKSTHEKYKEKCGDKLGKTILGIFTDEPHRGRLMSSFGSSQGEEDVHLEYAAPWTYTLFEHFEGAYGYDLKAKLPELFLRMQGSKVSQVKWHYVELIQRMFLDYFVKPIHAWCEANQMILTGHMLQEDSLTAQTAMSGSAMRLYEYMGYPGVDVLTEFNQNYWLVKQLTSVARQTGQRWRLSELYGCTGWQMPFESHKTVGDWQALFGVNLRCHHLSWYTMQGEAKRDYPASIFHQSAWWKEYKYVEDYFSRVGVAMSAGSPVCDTLVIHPIESVWSQIYPGWCTGLSARDPDIRKLEDQFTQLFQWLAGAHIDFDYGDEEMMSRLCEIERDDQGRAWLRVGEAVYRQVMVAGMTTIRSSTLHRLEAFIDAGGHVVFAGEAPSYVDAIQSDKAQSVCARALQVEFEQSSVIQACQTVCPPIVEIRDAEGNPLDEVFLQVREGHDFKLIMLLNMNRHASHRHVDMVIHADGFVQEWDCTTGSRCDVLESRNGLIRFTADFPPGGERLLLITPERNSSIERKKAYTETDHLVIDGPFEYELDEPNVCVLDMARFQIDDGEWQPEAEILQIDRFVRETFGLDYRAGNMIQPWFSKNEETKIKGRVTLGFEFFVSEMPCEIPELVMERPEHFQVKLNGVPIDTSVQCGFWVDICFKRIPLSPNLFVPGKNTLEVTTDFHQGIDLESLYLLGNFGVKLEGNRKSITALPSHLAALDLTVQGLPFYSGKVTYRIPVECKPKHGERMYIELEQFGGACAKVNPESSKPQMIAWKPYEAEITGGLEPVGEIRLQIILTRRNTFGPLHQVPLHAKAYAPANFITQGERFTEAYNLVPTGILSAPKMSNRSSTPE